MRVRLALPRGGDVNGANAEESRVQQRKRNGVILKRYSVWHYMRAKRYHRDIATIAWLTFFSCNVAMTVSKPRIRFSFYIQILLTWGKMQKKSLQIFDNFWLCYTVNSAFNETGGTWLYISLLAKFAVGICKFFFLHKGSSI